MTKVRSRFQKSLRPIVLGCLLGLSLTVGGMLIRGTRADLNAPTASDRQVAVAVASLLNREHLSRHPLNEEMSQRWMTMFLKTIDPRKLYFLQEDIDRFMLHRNELGERLQHGDVGFSFEVFNVYLKRLDERLVVIDELLKMPHDFTVDESLDVDFDKRPYAKDAAELKERWRMGIKRDLLEMKLAKTEAVKIDAAKVKGTKTEGTKLDGAKADHEKVDVAKYDETESREKLAKRYHSFARNMKQFNHEDLLETYLTALTTSYDPHTSYMSAASVENFEILMTGTLDGIGAALQATDGTTVVSKIIPGGAADKEKSLKVKDQIIGVGQGLDGPIVDVVDMRLNDVIKFIRGKRGTVVRLQVLPGGTGKPKVFSITRAAIELSESLARSEIITAGTRGDGQPYKIGVIDLPSFYMDMNAARIGKADFRSTTRDVKKLLEDFKTKGVDAVILDLSRNGGGALTEAINLTGLFIGEGPVVQVKDADGKVQHYDDQDPGAVWEGPLVVLTSKFSASASEIFAGAIQDYHRGLVVGDHTTHGKGTVQSMLDLGRQLFRAGDAAPKWGSLKITMQQFYRPDGDSTQNQGVLADVELPSLRSQLDIGEKDLEYALKFDKVEPASFKLTNFVERPMVVELSRRSKDRCDSSGDFKKVAQRIERYRKQKDQKSVTLNEKKFMAERAEFNADDEEEKQLEDQDGKERPVVERNYYYNEALAVTTDYLELLGKGKVAAAR